MIPMRAGGVKHKRMVKNEEGKEIERKFGEAKQGHGVGRCRYIGRTKFAVQAFFIAMVLNLKRMVRVLSQVGYKTRYAPAA